MMDQFKHCIAACLICLLLCFDWTAATAYEWQSDGYAYLKTRIEFADDEDNAYLYSYIDYHLTEKDNRLPRVHISGWLREDYYSEDNGAEYDTLQITRAYVAHELSGFGIVAGRHSPGKVETFPIDGGQVFFSKNKNSISVYGGKPVTYYEIDYDEDALAGASVQFNYKWRTLFKLDLFYVKQESQWHDNLMAAFYQHIPPVHSRCYLRMRAHEGKLGDMFTKLTVLPPRYNTLLSLDYFLQRRNEDNDADRYLGYNNVFGRRYGYHRFSLSFQQPVRETLFFNTQVTVKRSADDEEEDHQWLNVDSNIFTAGLYKYDLFHPDLGVGLFGNYIDNEDNEFYDISGTMDFRFNDRHSISGGITFTGYSYGDLRFSDTLNDQESVYDLYGHVGSKIFFAEYELKLEKNRKFSFHLAYEDNDTPYQDAVIMNLKYRLRF